MPGLTAAPAAAAPASRSAVEPSGAYLAAVPTPGLSAYAGPVSVDSRQREVATALLDAPGAEPLDLGAAPEASSPTTAATRAATDLTGSSATLHGVAEHAAGGSRAGFLWGTDVRSLTPTEPEPLAAVDGTFSGTLKDLDAETVYYFRTIVETPESGRLLGDVKQFRTLPAPPPGANVYNTRQER